MNSMVLAAFFASTALLVGLAIAALIPLLRKSRVLDHPNDRSSHLVPTPRGAGAAVIPLVAGLWIAVDIGWGQSTSHALVWPALSALLLCALSWFDDVKGLPPLVRFCAHIFVVAVLLYVQPSDVLYAQGLLPVWADRLVAGFVWVWFINLFNFMDGIDGISGVETLAIGLGITAMTFGSSFLIEPLALPAVVLAGAALGFLALNWHPAKIFLGDSGSVPLGLLLGWLLLELAAAGYWAAALILPLYYLADATITLLRRFARHEKIWQAHRQHFYQRAVAGGLSHSRVSSMIALANAGLIVLAILSGEFVVGSLVGAVLITALLLAAMHRRAAAL
jgi:UDP-N-acetylmuramyl pentapeptide phosphotransferase/UDP-N-acetylglucosamine-1-phosphate transferase